MRTCVDEGLLDGCRALEVVFECHLCNVFVAHCWRGGQMIDDGSAAVDASWAHADGIVSASE